MKRLVPFTLLGVALTAPCLVKDAAGAELLPYSSRTLPYSGWGTTARGDIRTVGMAGATVGLADTFIAASSNPAGLAMTLKDIDTNFASNTIQDRYLQSYESPVTVNNIGVATAIYPWGFSVGYTSPFREGQEYNVGGQDARLSVTTRDLRFAAARNFFDNRLALGASANFGQAELEINSPYVSDSSTAYHPYAVGATLGALYQLPKRLLLGASYSLPMHYAVDPLSNPTPILPGFYEPVEVPGVFSLGVGWIPNRYFRGDFSVSLVGATPRAALLSNQETQIGEHLTVQPRIGAAYLLADYRHFQATVFAGIYDEVPRTSTIPNRIHWTAGLEAKPWILSFGWGIDVGSGYRNYIFSGGLDVIKAMQKLELVPEGPPMQSGRIFPIPTRLSDQGLARPLVRKWKADGTRIDPIQAGLDLPGKVQRKFQDAETAIKGVLVPPKPPSPRRGKKPKQVSKPKK